MQSSSPRHAARPVAICPAAGAPLFTLSATSIIQYVPSSLGTVHPARLHATVLFSWPDHSLDADCRVVSQWHAIFLVPVLLCLYIHTCTLSLTLLLARLHIVYGDRLVTVAGVCRRSSSSVTLHGGPAGGFTHAGQAMTHGGLVVLRPVRATPCMTCECSLS